MARHSLPDAAGGGGIGYEPLYRGTNIVVDSNSETS
jgi:hypothetical protein